jgi:hypothetical protein
MQIDELLAISALESLLIDIHLQSQIHWGAENEATDLVKTSK